MEVFVLLEFIGFAAVASGVLWIQGRKGSKNDMPDKMSRFFRNAGIGVKERDKDGQVLSVQFPHYKGRKVQEWGTTYTFQLPIGMSFKMLSVSENLDAIFEAMFNRDIEVSEGTHNCIQIHVYDKRLPELVRYEKEWLDKCKGYRVIIGQDHKKLVFHNFDYIPHLIIGGMTRYGKSVVMKLLIAQLAMTQQGVKFHLFDLKGGLAFNRFKSLPQVHSVARDEIESLESLKRIRKMIKKRQLYFEEKGYEDIGEAWKAGECFDRDIIIIDEASVLAPTSKSDQIRNQCRSILEFIAQVAGGMGYNLIMCSQYPTGDILPRQVKQNSDARLSFRLPTSTASGVILDETGAEEIPHGLKGRAIYKTDLTKMIQVPYMSNDMIDELIKPMKVSEVIDYKPTEEDRTGTCDNEHTEEPGPSKQVATSADSLFRY